MPARPDGSGVAPGVDWAGFAERLSVSGSLVTNGGFEHGLAPWFAPALPGWRHGEVLAGPAHGGARSLFARLRGEAGSADERRWGAIYEVGTVPFPRHASLWYRVERWQPANAIQYLLLAVMVGTGGQTWQVRYFLAGAAAIPYNEKGNVRYVLVRQGPPEIGRWVSFATDLHRDFEQRWGRVPRNFEWLRIAVEARYDTRGVPLDREAAADVYFDDVYVGYSER